MVWVVINYDNFYSIKNLLQNTSLSMLSSSVPILECGFGIVHQEGVDEVAVQESGCALQDVMEGAYSLEEESLLGQEVVGRPTEVLGVLLGVELVNAGDQVAEDLPSMVPYDVDEVVPQVPVGAP